MVDHTVFVQRFYQLIKLVYFPFSSIAPLGNHTKIFSFLLQKRRLLVIIPVRVMGSPDAFGPFNSLLAFKSNFLYFLQQLFVLGQVGVSLGLVGILRDIVFEEDQLVFDVVNAPIYRSNVKVILK